MGFKAPLELSNGFYLERKIFSSADITDAAVKIMLRSTKLRLFIPSPARRRDKILDETARTINTGIGWPPQSSSPRRRGWEPLRMWRNWQTRRLQVPVSFGSWRFDSSHPHLPPLTGQIESFGPHIQSTTAKVFNYLSHNLLVLLRSLLTKIAAKGR